MSWSGRCRRAHRPGDGPFRVREAGAAGAKARSRGRESLCWGPRYTPDSGVRQGDSGPGRGSYSWLFSPKDTELNPLRGRVRGPRREETRLGPPRAPPSGVTQDALSVFGQEL